MKKAMRLVRFSIAVLSIFCLVSPLFSQVVLNEILYDPNGTDTGKEWIEIFNPSDSPVDMDGWDLDCAEAPYYHFQSFILHAHSYVVVHLRQDGTDTQTDLYTGANWGSDNMGNAHGEVTLYNSTSHTKAHLIDFVEWGATGQTHESSAISAGQWPDPPDFAPSVSSGHSICYDGSGNSGADWQDGATPTPGSDNSLSIFLSSFSATPEGDHIVIRWTTQSEVQTLGFQVFRRLAPSEDFVPVSPLIRGQGNTAARHSYRFVDRDVQRGQTYFYRLKDIDFDGGFSFHGTVTVRFGEENPAETLPEEFQISDGYPNPFGPSAAASEIRFSILLPSQAVSSLSAAIYNLLGQEVFRFQFNEPSAEARSISWNGSSSDGTPVPAGVYFLRVQQGAAQKIRPILFLR